MDAVQRTRWVVEQARQLGFDLCGVAPAHDFPELERLPEWLDRGYAGEMEYLRNPRRQSPAAALPGARSIVVCAINYNTDFPYSTDVPAAAASTDARDSRFDFRISGFPSGWISRYAWGDDYHDVLGEKLQSLLAAMRQQFPEPFEARWYVDTGPVVERVAAKYAGLGWLAKNTCLIHPELGSWLFLGVILTTLDLAPSLAPDEPPQPDLCGSCTLCIEACPTGAIVEPYVLDSRRCISYLTIELRGPIPGEFHSQMGRMVFGCDICQDVCPWNRKAPVTTDERFLPRKAEIEGQTEEDRVSNFESRASRGEQQSLFAPSLEWLASLTEDDFRRYFRGSAVKRTKWRGLIRNARIALANAGRT